MRKKDTETFRIWRATLMFCDLLILYKASKVIQDCNVFTTLRSVIGQENYHNSLNQSDAELKPTASR